MNTNKQVSIQLALDGHSFSILGATNTTVSLKAIRTGESDCCGDEKELEQKSHSGKTDGGQEAAKRAHGVELIEVLTPKSVLVPQSLFAPEHASSLLAMQGLVLSEEEVVMTAFDSQHNDAVAVMAIPRALQLYIAQHYGNEVTYTTPLLHLPTVLEPTIYLCDTGSLIYIKVYEPHLILAEVVPATDEEVEYLLQRLSVHLDVTRFLLHLESRHRNKRRVKSYKQYFKKIVCV